MEQTFPIKFGEAGQYELCKDALKHILEGDTKIRPFNGPDGRTQETVLSGGLHAWDGWQKFVALHPNVVHLLQYRVDKHDDWFYARELQNGVITLKIPRRLYTGGAANITKQPDLHYKSGYLWKTLYPVSYTRETILKVIGEALLNIDREDSTPPTKETPMGVIFGYARVHAPFEAIKVRIQLDGNQIKSAFPAWDQPRTGNNGKPYSHEHSISFQIAASTVGGADYMDTYGTVFKSGTLDIRTLVSMTPTFIRTRAKRDMAIPVDKWQASRQVRLEQIAAAVTSAEVQAIDAYLADYVCAKDPYRVQQGLYASCLKLIDEELEVFNTAQLVENIAECFFVLGHCDQRFNSRRAVDAMLRFLRMAVVHTGWLNTLMFKRLLSKMVTVAMSHHDPSAIKEFLGALAGSPNRATLYTEFDLNPFVKTNDEDGLCIIGLPQIQMEVTPDHLLEFAAFNLGENYMLLFSKAQRLAIAKQALAAPGMVRMATDAMALFVGSDFEFFIPQKLELMQLGECTAPAEDDLMSIAKDYARMLVILRQRLVLEDPVAYQTEPDFSQWGTQEFFELIRQKHKHTLVMAMHKDMLKDMISYAASVGYERLKTHCERSLTVLHKEQIPLGKPIPDYINSWRTTAKQEEYDVDEMVEKILGLAPTGTE